MSAEAIVVSFLDCSYIQSYTAGTLSILVNENVIFQSWAG